MSSCRRVQSEAVRSPRVLWGRLIFAGWLLVAICVLPYQVVRADARSDYMINLLRTSSSFRVRAQAALSLSRFGTDRRAASALVEALRDGHPSVRVAAAATLERIGDPTALAALRSASRDRDPTVRRTAQRAVLALERVARAAAVPPRTTTPAPTPPPQGGRFYVGVGMPGAKIASINRDTLRRTREIISSQIRQMSGVVLAPEDETPRRAEVVLRERALTGFYIDSSIVQIDERPGSTRAAVSVIVGTYPGRDMRAILQGAATVQGVSGAAEARDAAIEGALTGALRRLPQALEAGNLRASRDVP